MIELLLPVDPPVEIVQGFDSRFTHSIIKRVGTKTDERYSLDFKVDEGSNIYAARDGIVDVVILDHDFNYFHSEGENIDPELLNKAMYNCNLITILHRDHTRTLYMHLQQQKPLVQPREFVEEGQLIAYSGNTGFSKFPHLHFSLFLMNQGEFAMKTVPFYFKNHTESLYERDFKR